MKNNLATGRWGEQLAAAYLEQRGIKMIARNVRTPYGEIDLVGRSDEITIFIEVKTRRNEVFGMPEDAVTKRKFTHIFESAQVFLQEHPDLGEDWRIDVLAIQKRTGEAPPHIEWFENVTY
ncbi:MAG: YraN family protein [Anaerolineaceae bacterium]|nr:YraN family protein [Anaerolineaceae bacterium]